MAKEPKPLPNVDRWNKPFWDAAREGWLAAQRCLDCGRLHTYPSPALQCTECLSTRQEWVRLSGKGYIWSFVVYHHLWHKGFEDDLPYNVALIQIDEGVQIPANVVGIANQELRVGMRVEVVFEEIGPGVTIPKFRPVLPYQFVPYPVSTVSRSPSEGTE